MSNLVDTLSKTGSGVIIGTTPLVLDSFSQSDVQGTLHLLGVIIVAIMQFISLFKKEKIK